MESCGFNFDTTYTSLPEVFFTELRPESTPEPHIVVLNDALATSMGLDFSSLSPQEQADLFSGNQLPATATPLAQAYAGHQFGYFTLLGDGRAHLWGEHLTPDAQRLDIQFKGSGRTPYSRRGDGKAVLGPMLREYLISEAMHHLGVPTTRSLAVAMTGERVLRETALLGAILTRVASSHIRVGTFEFAAARTERPALEALLDYTIQRHYPELAESENKALDLLQAVIEKQADLITQWMRIGFVHGVMNTDNMTLSGETIDYGPCAFMDRYSKKTVFSSIDQMGRYAYGNQPNIAQWNLARLAEALLPLIDADASWAVTLAEEVIHHYPDLYQSKWRAMMRAKLGLQSEEEGDEKLLADLLTWMEKQRADYTNTFRDLTYQDRPSAEIYQDRDFKEWSLAWHARRKRDAASPEASRALMQASNPLVIPRNHRVEHALAAAQTGDLTPFQELLAALEHPYQQQEEWERFQEAPGPDERIYQTFCGT